MKLIKTQADLKESYNRLYSRGSGKLLVQTGQVFNDWVLSILRPTPSSRLLDISCGRGFFLESAVRWTPLSFGADLSERAVAEASQLIGGCRLAISNAEALPFEDSSFDTITSLGSLEHYLNPDLALREFARCLIPGGRLFVFVPNGYYLGHFWSVLRRGKGPSHDQDFERFEAIDFWTTLISQEFRVEQIYGYNPGTGVSLVQALGQATRLIHRGQPWQGAKFMFINLAFRAVPLNISKYLGFLCSRHSEQTRQQFKESVE